MRNIFKTVIESFSKVYNTANDKRLKQYHLKWNEHGATLFGVHPFHRKSLKFALKNLFAFYREIF